MSTKKLTQGDINEIKGRNKYERKDKTIKTIKKITKTWNKNWKMKWDKGKKMKNINKGVKGENA